METSGIAFVACYGNVLYILDAGYGRVWCAFFQEIMENSCEYITHVYFHCVLRKGMMYIILCVTNSPVLSLIHDPESVSL